MKYIADFHIHSKYSRATARDLDFENLYISSQIKGITVVGTGDFTHPAWWQEISDKLVAAEQGLFKLREDIARSCDELVPASCRRPIRFILTTEISNIYKKEEKTRKNHNLVFMPDLQSAERFRQRLDQIGNIRSDGRPILGLDARNLLEIVLETTSDGYLIPAHIWTPWFSLLGSKSGFDSVEACFGDLSRHIFALETGLSSDPPMNWRVSGLDRYTLVSNSDAHSPAKLGREANRFDTDLSYGAIRSALEDPSTGAFQGTIEFFPEEGKYHLDGHRKCNFRSLPARTRELSDLCPVCGKPLTLGVLYRVENLADRPAGARPATAAAFKNLIPLEDILAEVFQVGGKSKRVAQAYDQLITRFGSEFDILNNVPGQELEKCGIPLLAEALGRMRESHINFDAGYDGEFGQVRIFSGNERQILQGQQCLFDIPQSQEPCPAVEEPAGEVGNDEVLVLEPQEASPKPATFQLNPEQQAAVDHTRGPLIIVAGPGTGKTRTITCRMAALIEKKIVQADRILAVTFTNQAAQEMRTRIKGLLGETAAIPLTATFHSLCRRLLQEAYDNEASAIADETTRRDLMADAVFLAKTSGSKITLSPESLLAAIIEAKQQLLGPDDDLSPAVNQNAMAQVIDVYRTYQALLTQQNLYDYEDLILQSVDILQKDAAWRKALQQRYTYIFVDEFQDINYGQYRLVRLLAPESANICVIGDPDQAIYGFRGSDVRYFHSFIKDYPKARSIHLAHNYRSTETILASSFQVICGHQLTLGQSAQQRTYSSLGGFKTISVIESPSAGAEAVAIGQTIEKLVGGTGFHAVDFGKTANNSGEASLCFGDFAVLFRTTGQGRQIYDVLSKAGLPCQWVNREDWRTRPAVAKLLAVLRFTVEQATYADLGLLAELVSPNVGKATRTIFKTWAYARQLPLNMALQTTLRIPVPGMSTAQQYRLVALVRWLNNLRKEAAGLNATQVCTHIWQRMFLDPTENKEDLQRLIYFAEPFKKDLQGFLANQALQKDSDIYQPGVEKIVLLTMHAAKGLEFPVVFIAGCEDGLIPYSHSNDVPTDLDPKDLDEERRLFYVAMTRARERLIFSWARKRALYGRTGPRRFSPFAQAIEKKLKETLVSGTKTPVKKQEQLALF